MAGTASIEYEVFSRGVYSGSNRQRIIYTLLSSSGGGTGGSVDASPTKEVLGEIGRVTIHPNKTAKPTDNWDLYLFDGTASQNLGYGSVDLLASAGENMTDDHSIQLVSTNDPLIAGRIRLVARNMGVAKKAQVIVYLK